MQILDRVNAEYLRFWVLASVSDVATCHLIKRETIGAFFIKVINNDRPS